MEILKMFTLCLMLIFVHMNAEIIPSSYTTATSSVASVNGSSVIGHCSSVFYDGPEANCTRPATSVLFDGVIPTLTGLDGDMWASQLLTLEKFISYTFLISHFDNTPGFAGINGRVEVVMFNCPQWGISAQKITVITSTSFSGPVSILGVYIPSITSCNSLVRVCIPHITTITPLIVLLITYDQDSNWVHLAEVTVFENDASCPPDGGTTVATSPLTTDATTYTTNSSTSMPPLLSDAYATQSTDATPSTESDATPLSERTTTSLPPNEVVSVVSESCSPQNETCNSCILASVVTAIVTAVLSIVIFVLVQIAVCKCHIKLKSRGAETGNERQGYELVDGDQGGASENNPIYAVVGERLECSSI